ncbi:MAG: hypothetical protein JNM24_15500 [Bdellovibrionaceae bacterium]|nr:hypothetical protein [Pseudobdellovibrionaceae bacterium]
MKEHKVKQLVFNRLGTFDDNLNSLTYILAEDPKDIIQHAVDYFQKPCSELIYPAKSYAVAIIYAHLLEKNFDDEFSSSLDDVDLFCGNDKFFVPYSSDKKTYDTILERIGYSNAFVLNTELPQISKTVRYFQSEFQLEVLT